MGCVEVDTAVEAVVGDEGERIRHDDLGREVPHPRVIRQSRSCSLVDVHLSFS